jgi:hypothetical protein
MDLRNPCLGFTQCFDAGMHGMGTEYQGIIMRDRRAHHKLCVGLGFECMYKAAALQRDDHRKLIDIARSVGYDSDAAFSKTFKRVTGMVPGEYRRSVVD